MAARIDFDEDLVHGLCSMVDAMKVAMLGTVSYSELQESNWTSETDWVQDIDRDDIDWILPIRDGNNWQAVRISWSDRRILCYNPVCSMNAERRNIRILEVGRYLLCCRSQRLTMDSQDTQKMVQGHRGTRRT
jgi:hypothetical protein